MSDILIKNMKMPKDCLHCGFSHMASDCLKIWIICKPKDISVTDGDAVKDGRPDWCPLVEVPSADVAPVKHGRWIEYPECLRYENAYSVDHIVCSECGEVFSILDNDTERFDFCPHCGADLR